MLTPPAVDRAPSSRPPLSVWFDRSLTRRSLLLVMGTGLSVAIAACGGGTTGTTASPEAGSATNVTANQPETVAVTLVSFAVTKAAHDRIIPKFVEHWPLDKTSTRLPVAYPHK